MASAGVVTVSNVTVFGSGSFAMAMAYVLSKNNHKVTILSRSEEQSNAINTQHKNPKHFPEFILPNNIGSTTDPKEALKNVDYIVHAVPVQSTPEYLKNIKDFIPKDVPFINVSKGIHIETLNYMSNIVPDILGRPQPFAAVSGPSFAKELLQNLPTALVVACQDNELAIKIQHLFASTTVRVYTSNDVLGVELGGALKNVIAIAAGFVQGVGYGSNTTALVVTRGCNEMMKLALDIGASPLTLAGLTGYGDLMLTCFGSLSRNRTVGIRLGQGESIDQILASLNDVAEGVATTGAAIKLAEKSGINVPIMRAVYQLIYEKTSSKQVIEELMNLPHTSESFPNLSPSNLHQ